MKACLISTSQPSANPRLVKEADALTEIGADVHVIGAQWADWAIDADRELLASRTWSCEILDWRRSVSLALFWKSRIRHFAARQLVRVPVLEIAARSAAMSRVGPDLLAAAFRTRADVFIAHNLGALPVAIAAARRSGARIGFDAEDFHSGQLTAPAGAARDATERAERAWLPQCDYVTAAAPGIAWAYRDLCGITCPAIVLNVFPLRHRPRALRETEHMEPLTLYWFSQTIGPHRGLEDAVRAMGLLPPRSVELHLRGAWQPGYEAVLRTLAQDAGLHQRQILAHPPAPADEMVRLAAAYDVGLALEQPVSVNRDICLSNKIFTYVLAGNAVVATRTAGHMTVVPHLGDAVRTYDAGNIEEMASVLRHWLQNRSVLASARQSAWRAGETRFNWDIEKATFLAAVRAVLAPS